MDNKLRADADFKKVATDFFNLARDAVVTDPKKIPEMVMHAGFRSLNGIMFAGSVQLSNEQRDLILRCTKLLGPKIAHEKEIEDIAWECVCQSLDGDKQTSDLNQIVTQFTEKLLEHIQSQFVYVAPNYAFTFEKDLAKIQIGPVEAMLTTELLPEISDSHENKRWSLSVGSEFKMRIVDAAISFEFPPVVWRVSIQAARGHVEEEATWLINIAISLLRLSYPVEKHYSFFPRIGEKESLPIILEPITKQGMTLAENGAWSGETTARKIYEIDEGVLAVAASESFKRRAHAIFYPARRSLGERLGQGLGWMSRARQTSDRAEKFLFFFTAIEALLSSDDKTAPVVQTISRYVAVILWDEAKPRFQLANLVKSLYVARSALIHTGKRNVSNLDVRTIQQVVENVYWVVMDRMELATSFEKFHASLSEASYGLTWQLKVADETNIAETL